MSASAELIALADDAGGAGCTSPAGFDGLSGLEEARQLLGWERLYRMWELTSRPRRAFCRRFSRGQIVTVVRSGDRASWSNLQTCGWPMCPKCGPRIAVERSADVALAVVACVAAGGLVSFSTATMQHFRAQRLVDLLAGQRIALKAMRDDRLVKRHSRLWLDGEIYRFDTTYGRHGWHPHRHVLGFHPAGVTPDQAHELDELRYAAYGRSFERQGLGKLSRKGHDFQVLTVEGVHEKLAQYIAQQAGHELASGIKRGFVGRTFLQLLDDGERDLVHEFEAATERMRWIRWSPGLRDLLLPEYLAEERSDDEAAAAVDDARTIAGVSTETWEAIKRAHLAGRCEQVASGSIDDEAAVIALGRYLIEHGLGDLLLGDGELADPECESSLSGLVTRPARRNDVV